MEYYDEVEMHPLAFYEYCQIKVKASYMDRVKNSAICFEPSGQNDHRGYYYGRILKEKNNWYLVAFLREEINLETQLARYDTLWVHESHCDILGVIDNLNHYALKKMQGITYMDEDLYIDGFIDNINYKANTYAKISSLMIEKKHIQFRIAHGATYAEEIAYLDRDTIYKLVINQNDKYNLLDHAIIDKVQDVLYYEDALIALLKYCDGFYVIPKEFYNNRRRK